MPADEGLGFDNYQGVSPEEESRPQEQRKTSGGGELAGWNSVFLVEGKLLAQEQYFGTQGSPGRKCQSQEMGALGDGSNKRIRTNDRNSCTVLSMFTWGLTGSSL